ncbi:MAG: Gfo/Idh/MocA family oxidoreductase [Oscillospiraceae bacterium]|jgi:predicted dehydrogenase|nr:Gfo/Idh/MocA family oxidoreductase [Oscillospiraceae bacterium]
MSKTYTVAVLGAGKRGKMHAKLFSQDPRFELVGICDFNEERLEAAAAESGNPKTFNDVEQMLSETKPDVFCFCTPPAVRKSLFEIGIKHNVQLIAFEKPLSTNFNEAQELYDLAKAAGIKWCVSHQQKYGDHYQAVKEIVESGKLGRIQTIYAHVWGWYWHMITHVMDYVRMYNGNAEAEWVSGTIHGRGKLEDNHPSPEYAGGFIQFANGVRGIIEAGELSPDVPESEYPWHKGRFVIQGTEGFAEIIIGAGWRGVNKTDGYQEGTGCFDYEIDGARYIADIALWLDGVKEHPCNGEDTYKGFQLAIALLRSAVENKIIHLPLEAGENEVEAMKKALPVLD